MKIKYVIAALIAPIINQGTGDKNNSLVIRDHIYNQIETPDKILQEISTQNLNSFIDEMSKTRNTEFVLTATGSDAINSINNSQLKDSKPDNLKIIASSHQYSEAIKNSIGIADIISVASHAINAEQIREIEIKSKYVSAIGASSSITQEEINQNYLKLEKEFEEFTKSEKTAAMLFGGDSSIPNSTDKKALTEESSKKIGRFIAQDMHSKGINKLILTDGPRAGAYLGRKDGEVNQVIQALIDELKKRNIEVLYKPFIMNEEKRKLEPSAYRALLSDKFDHYYYTEESISTGFEMAIFKQLNGKATAIEGSSTLPEHKKFAHSLKDKGYISFAEINSEGEYELNSPKIIATEPLDREINNKNIYKALEELLQKFKGFFTKKVSEFKQNNHYLIK